MKKWLIIEAPKMVDRHEKCPKCGELLMLLAWRLYKTKGVLFCLSCAKCDFETKEFLTEEEAWNGADRRVSKERRRKDDKNDL